MILVDSELESWAKSGGILPYNPRHLNPASLDLTWSGLYRRPVLNLKALLYPRQRLLLWVWSSERAAESVTLHRGQFVLLDTTEFIHMPANCTGLIFEKSSIARQGLDHLLAGYVDPGFEGTLTLEHYQLAPWKITITRGDRLVQLVLARCEQVPRRSYAGHYQGQRGPTPSWY